MGFVVNHLSTYFLNGFVNRIIFAFLGGIFLSLSLASIGLHIVAWVGLIPLILLIRSANSFNEIFRESFVFGFAYNLIGFMWLLTIHPLTWQGFNLVESFFIALAAWILPTLFHTLLIMIFSILAKYIFALSADHSILRIVLTALLWSIIQHKLSMNMGPLSIMAIPMNALAYSQYHFPDLIRIANIIGTIGIEFVIVAMNLAVSDLFVEDKQFFIHRFGDEKISLKAEFNPKNMFLILSVMMLLALMIFYGLDFKRNFLKSRTTQSGISYSIVQGNLSEASIRGQDLDPRDVIDTHFDLSENLNTDILLWPEGTVPTTNRKAVPPLIFDYLKTNKPYKLFIFGTYFSKASEAERKIFNSIELKEYDNGQISSEFYHKRLLVPFGEYTPFVGLLPGALQNLARSVVGSGFTEGPKAQDAIKTNLGKIGSSLCFELLFPHLVRDQVLSGAEVLVNLSDLSWFKSDLVKKQFIATGIFRAIENTRDLLIASNSGYSVHVNMLGEIEEISKANMVETIRGKIQKNKDISLFTRYGW